MSVRKRVLYYHYPSVTADLLDSAGNLLNHAQYLCDLTGSQETFSNGHPHYASKRFKGADCGGSFYTLNSVWSSTPGYADTVGKAHSLQYTYKGPVFAQFHTGSAAGVLPPPLINTDAAMNAYGTIGISRALPTNPLSNMGQFLGELRDIPKMPGADLKKMKAQAKKFRSLSRNGSKEYLNIQFGWVPFISDLRDFAKVTASATKQCAQYARNSGRDVRRGSTVSKSSSTSTSKSSGWVGSPTMPDATYKGTGGTLTTTKTVETNIYFRGAFTYYLPSGDDLPSRMIRFEQYANKLYGIRLTPDLLWKLAPWSWAADWLVDIGPIVKNWSAFTQDGLVMRYGYVMAHSVSTTTISGQDLQLFDGHTVSAVDRVVSELKQRSRATPYGFGLNPSSFSAKQWSIIGALGISKAPRSLNF